MSHSKNLELNLANLRPSACSYSINFTLGERIVRIFMKLLLKLLS